MSHDHDVLLEIPDESLPKLAYFYKKNAPWAPYMFTFIISAIKWKQSNGYKNLIHFWSPDGSWERDGTVVALTEIHSQDIYVFTLEQSCTNLYRGLSKTKRINFNTGRLIFYCIHEKHIPAVQKVIEEKALTIKQIIPAVFLGLSPEDAKECNPQCRPEVTIKKLHPSDAEIISKVNPYAFVNHAKYTSSLIEIHGGYGVFLNSTNTLVAWLVRHVFGIMTMLQTDDKYKRKGYASLLIKELAKELGEEGFWAVSTVDPHNTAAIKTFESLGFRVFGAANYFIVE